MWVLRKPAALPLSNPWKVRDRYRHAKSSSCDNPFLIFNLRQFKCFSFPAAARPSNDRCIDSITLIPFEKVTGDNTEANFDYNNQGVCGARSDRRAVWYEINGVGKEVTINVCSNNYQITDFGIFRACNTQNCLGAPTQQMMIAACDAEEQNEYSFLAEDGASYYVHVRSDVFFEGIGSNVSLFGSRVIILLVVVLCHRRKCANRNYTLTSCSCRMMLAHDMVYTTHRRTDYGTDDQRHCRRHRWRCIQFHRFLRAYKRKCFTLWGGDGNEHCAHLVCSFWACFWFRVFALMQSKVYRPKIQNDPICVVNVIFVLAVLSMERKCLFYHVSAIKRFYLTNQLNSSNWA